MKSDISILDGYCFSTPEKNQKVLDKCGAVRLTGMKDILEMDKNPETMLERALVESFPDGGANNSDDYFIVSANGIEYLILEHAGQWFVGHLAFDNESGKLVNTPETLSVESISRQYAKMLEKMGYSEKKHFVPERAIEIEQTIDMPGVLDFAYVEATEFWPGEDGLLWYKSKFYPAAPLENTSTDYADGYYVDAWWNINDLDAYFRRFYENEDSRLSLLNTLQEKVPSGRLILPEGTKVQFRESDGSDGEYILLEVKAEEGKTLVKYLGVSDSDPMEDFARDLSDEDIREVLRAIGPQGTNA